MKLITWNCNMAFRKKAEFIIAEDPDILIVPECEIPDKISFVLYSKQPNDIFWYGDNPNKGIGVFTFGDLKIKLLEIHNPGFKYVLPLSVFNDRLNITVFAIWSQKPSKNGNYTEQVWNAVHYYNDQLSGDNIILAGDFNSNTIWDKPRRLINHSNLVNHLSSLNILSTYHHFHNQTQGEERHNTLFMQRNIDRAYHIDYCFASSNLIDKLKNVEVGTYEKWTKHSDHKPLTVKFDI